MGAPVELYGADRASQVLPSVNMEVNIHHYFHSPGESTIIGLLRQIINTQKLELEKENRIMKELDDLAAEVAANTDAEQSAVVLLGNLHDLLVAAGTDATKLAALTSQ